MNVNDAEIDDFFKTYVNGFMHHDVEATIRAKANFGAALMLLNYTEILGGLANGLLGEEGVASRCFEQGLSLMKWKGDPDYYKNFRVWLTDQNGRKQATPYKVFRCGLAHEYFVKGLALVHNNPDDPEHCVADDQGFGWIDEAGERRLRFHTNAYFRDLRAGYEELRARVKAGGQPRTDFEKAVKCVMTKKVEP